MQAGQHRPNVERIYLPGSSFPSSHATIERGSDVRSRVDQPAAAVEHHLPARHKSKTALRSSAEAPLYQRLQDVESSLVGERAFDDGSAIPPGRLQLGEDLQSRAEVYADVRQVSKSEVPFGRLYPRAEPVCPVVFVTEPRLVADREIGRGGGTERNELQRLPPYSGAIRGVLQIGVILGVSERAHRRRLNRSAVSLRPRTGRHSRQQCPAKYEPSTAK